jgi:hypothetical protein
MDFNITDLINELRNIPVVDTNQGMRDLRNRLLKENVDTVNPVRYAALTAEQQQELAAYRQALLDAPQQTTWPTDVVWPTKPTWL